MISAGHRCDFKRLLRGGNLRERVDGTAACGELFTNGGEREDSGAGAPIYILYDSCVRVVYEYFQLYYSETELDLFGCANLLSNPNLIVLFIPTYSWVSKQNTWL